MFLGRTATQAANHLQAVRRQAGNVVRHGLNLVYPPCCLFCDGDLQPPVDGVMLCMDCRAGLMPTMGIICPRCGAPCEHAMGPVVDCPDCRGHKLAFDSVMAHGVYEDALRSAVLQIKRPGHVALAQALTDLFWQRSAQDMRDREPQLVVPIPMHWLRRWRRQVNAPEVVARSLAGYLGVRFDARLVGRRNTRTQGKLTRAARWRNVAGTFRLRGTYDFKGLRILLVDDVLTTGATCSEAARLLKRAGAQRVDVAVLARAHSAM